jgi:hypothetical protein
VRKQIAKARHKAFDSTVACVAWCVWLERNDRVFRTTTKSEMEVARAAWNLLHVWCIMVGSVPIGE